MSVSATEKAALLDLTQQLVAGITALVVDPVPDPRDEVIAELNNTVQLLTTDLQAVTQQRDALQARIDAALPHINSAATTLTGL
jgi:hypothetical protein